MKNREAMYEYGKMIFRRELGVNQEEALVFCQQSMKQHFLKAFFKYGLILNKKEESIYFIKLAADKVYPRAIYYYTSDLGHTQAMYKYALYQYNNDSDQNSIQEACKLFNKASDKGLIDSMFYYGLIISEGDGVHYDPTTASRYLKIMDKLMQWLDMATCFYLEKVHRQIKKRLLIIYKMVFEKEMQKNYAFIKQFGHDVEIDKEEAIKYYKNAVDKGNADAMNNYGCMLQHGDIIDANKEEANKYYKWQ